MKYDIKICFTNKETLTLKGVEEEIAYKLFECMNQVDRNIFFDKEICINKSHVSYLMCYPTAKKEESTEKEANPPEKQG